MPIYEFACDECGHRFEVFRVTPDISGKSNPECSECRGRTSRKWSRFTVRYNTDGFYNTDNKKETE